MENQQKPTMVACLKRRPTQHNGAHHKPSFLSSSPWPSSSNFLHKTLAKQQRHHREDATKSHRRWAKPAPKSCHTRPAAAHIQHADVRDVQPTQQQGPPSGASPCAQVLRGLHALALSHLLRRRRSMLPPWRTRWSPAPRVDPR